MTVKYNVTGTKRKELVQLISNFTGCEIVYKGAPSFAYEVDYFTIDKSGALSFDDRADSEVIERLLEMLYDNGFESECLPEADEGVDVIGGSIFVPKETFTENSIENLRKIVRAKGSLIKKALCIESVELTDHDEYIGFPWISESSTPADVQAIMHFVSSICDMARTQKRITQTEKPVENECYSFRCFLLRLGFIGAEFKSVRKTLLKNLDGSSAFKAGRKTRTEENKNA